MESIPLINRYLKPETAMRAGWRGSPAGTSLWQGVLDRVRAWLHMLLADHGVFRVLYLNKHRVSEKLWRSAQPAPHQIARLKEQGIRTIVNLRGGREHGSWQLQKEICDRLGITLAEFVVRSRGAPDRDTILSAKAFFDELAYPAIMHCKSGADRAGFVAVLYLIVHEGPVRRRGHAAALGPRSAISASRRRASSMHSSTITAATARPRASPS